MMLLASLLITLSLADPSPGLAPDAPCATRPSARQVESQAGELVLLRLAAYADLAAVEASLRESLRCTAEVLSPVQAARVLRALRSDDPLGPFPDAPGVSLLAAPGTVWVDGVRTTTRPTARPAVVQITADPPEVARWSGVLAPDQELPAFRVSQAGLIRGSRRRLLNTPSRRLAAGSAGTAVASAVALGLAVHARARYLDQPAGPSPDPTWARVNVAAGVSGVALACVSAGLLGAALHRGDW